jgi:hypothetical protein
MAHPNIELMCEIFQWFNGLSAPRAEVRRSDVARFFVEDCEMSTNGVVKCRGIDAFVQHFEEIQQKLRWFAVQPLKKSLADDLYVAATYDILFEDAEGAEGRIVANVFWQVVGGRVSTLEEWAYTIGQQVTFETIN